MSKPEQQTNFSMIWLSVLLVDCWRPLVDDRGPCYNLSGKQYGFSNGSYPQERSSFLFCVETAWGMIYALHSSAEATLGWIKRPQQVSYLSEIVSMSRFWICKQTNILLGLEQEIP